LLNQSFYPASLARNVPLNRQFFPLFSPGLPWTEKFPAALGAAPSKGFINNEGTLPGWH
jgi:hypothetical protein